MFVYLDGAESGRIITAIPPHGSEEYYTARQEYVLHPGEQVTIPPNTLHWFQAGPTGAVVSASGRLQTDAPLGGWGQFPPADPVVASLMEALNETFVDATAQRYVFDSGPAPQLVLLLLGMALASMGGLGYQFGLLGQPLRTLTEDYRVWCDAA